MLAKYNAATLDFKKKVSNLSKKKYHFTQTLVSMLVQCWPSVIDDLKNLGIKDHRTEDRGFKPNLCEDQATKNAEFCK